MLNEKAVLLLERVIKNEYTNKIKAPVYTPTLEKKPELSDIVNREKYDELILKINMMNMMVDI